ncbi:hypothetical protein K435DRAFT_866472 [Dendrothele bispora CBS 962.96]|uniref:Ribonuclease H1 N-terminal domain-containing protein n=1 Tax=Dendrothele bispora (strain CBS 962.96) TaxID=1314807 RepID=A0A4S8LGV7_DENBC|nr:hypothetical protein K435DRAFT_866472 [Dendrothele bispora CBS 962.96]
MSNDLSACFQLPPGGRLLINCLDSEGSSGAQHFKLTLSPGQEIVIRCGSNVTSGAQAGQEVLIRSAPEPKGAVEISDSDSDTSSVQESDGYNDGKLVFLYRGFSRPAHPDELLWDGTRGAAGIYVVTRGRRVGIFQDWAVVKDLTYGVSGAEYKRFELLDDAIQFYTAAYDNLEGYVKLAVVASEKFLERPIVDDQDKEIRGHDVDIRVAVDGAIRMFSVSPTSDRKRKLPTPPMPTASTQVLSGDQASPTKSSSRK